MPKNNSAAGKQERRDVIKAACKRCNHQKNRHSKADGSCTVVTKLQGIKRTCDCPGYVA